MKKNFRRRYYFRKYVMSVEIVVINFFKENFSTYTQIRTYPYSTDLQDMTLSTEQPSTCYINVSKRCNELQMS